MIIILSEKEYLAYQLKKLAEKLGRTPLQDEFFTVIPRYYTIKCYGTYNKLLEYVGLDPNKENVGRKKKEWLVNTVTKVKEIIMFIRTQNMKMVIKFKDIFLKQDHNIILAINSFGNGKLILGQYSSEEKATKVMNEIVMSIKNRIMIYQMPLDEELKMVDNK